MLFFWALPPFSYADDAGAFHGKVPLKIYNIPDPKESNPTSQADLEIIRAFQRKHPEIELEAFSGIQIAGRSMDSSVLLAIAGGNAPDVMYVNFRQSDTYIQQSFLYPLDSFVKRDIPDAELANRVLSSVMPVIKRIGPKVDGTPPGEHIWALPNNLLVRALFYRKDLFEDAGLNPTHPPQNWNELYEYARRLSDPAKGRYGMQIAGGEQASWDFMSFIWSSGGEAVVQGKDGKWRAAYNSEQAVSALDFYLKLTAEKWIDSDGRPQLGYTTRTAGIGQYSAWTEGRVGMMVSYLNEKSIASGIDPSLVGIAPFPAGPTGIRATEINCPMMGIFSGIKGRENSDGVFVEAAKIRAAAWEYIRFYDSDEGRKAKIDKLVDLGLGRMLNPEMLRRYGYADYAKSAPPEWEAIFKEALREGKPEPYGRNCQEVYTYMTEPIDMALELARGGRLPTDMKEREAKLRKLLDASVGKTNRKMLGELTPSELRRRDIAAGVCATLVLAAFCFFLYKVWQSFSIESFTQRAGTGGHFKRYLPAYAILAPAVISVILWNYAPLVMGSTLTFYDYRLAGDSEFIGLRNIGEVLFSSDWWSSLYCTFKYMALLLGLGFVPPIALAIMLQEVSRGKVAYRVLYYLPAVMSGMAVIYMWRLFFGGDGFGLLNQVNMWLGSFFGENIPPIAWLEDSNWAMLCCVIPTIWAGLGPGCLIYLAALKGIPDELYEAAEIDGAGFGHKIWHIVLPSMKSLIVLQFIGAFVAASQNTQMVLVMTYGTAGTEVAGLHIFKEAYTLLRFGTAVSMAWMLGATLLAFTVYQLRMLRKMEFKAGGS